MHAPPNFCCHLQLSIISNVVLNITVNILRYIFNLDMNGYIAEMDNYNMSTNKI
jgi:hypothetical protein